MFRFSGLVHPFRGLVRRAFSTEAPSRLVGLKTSENGQVAVITMQRPEAKNAISKAFLYDLLSAVQEIRQSQTVRVALLRSSVPGVFCAGADLKERAKMTEEDVRVFVSSLREGFSAVASLPQPTIACIHGAALGGGLEVALACDFRCAAESATVGLPEVNLAIIPGAGGTQRLPRVIGVQKAKQWILMGKRVGAKEAQQDGVVDFVNVPEDPLLKMIGEVKVEEAFPEFFEGVESGTPEGQATGAGLRLASVLLEKGPVALRAAKRAITEGIQVDLQSAMDVERSCYEEVLQTSDRVEALMAFKEKRKAVFQGK
uniref:Enoyl-CoA hydratase n=1 Tax=Chromera velia CCMP2878 TaxID=1169474 RepID=A0A0G4I7G1_9ALVE|mmetsp:Transcript_7914/g.15404  ORF Transcript_7914/g.15404 Transcript_7914/m.15404 type:complete len:315 (-) Transcript_7914:150-1094(-)|eukprot:Cvel_11620.t1-p1 / transcript=Cvel_11620.t1 / gene=Cvel_11620 / organism=Chromera_velia_CCMP2878 / gene_product=Methylglutaconyl-CoA hydratase, mitochondrial, putative / transcript_product=Methylglutaconyl-CoA hydratase, mitochondrial, putative / location=Cvel_scaffold736:10302-11690(-) / protein_length=314 / sequence_SO=supercontig / SO=protein_coding / is_pseudo=false